MVFKILTDKEITFGREEGGGSDLCGSIIAEGIVQIYCVCFLRFPELHHLQAYLDLHVQQIMFGYLGIMDNTYIQNYPIKSG